MRRPLIIAAFLLGGLWLVPPSLPVRAAETEKRPNLMDNDELEKALAELGDDTPEIYSEKTPSSHVSSPSTATGVNESPREKPVQEAVEQVDEAHLTSAQLKAAKNKAAADKEDEIVFRESSSSRYIMMRHFEEADVQIEGIETDEKIDGEWKEGKFIFPGLEDTEIRTDKVTFPTGPRSVIRVSLRPKHIYRLRFSGVPPFSRVTMQYRLQEPASSKMLNYMYLKVYIGKYELKRLQVSSKDSWIKTVFNAGAVSFLNKSVPVTFEFATNQASGLMFSFIPETE